jgi:hypothetical protein
MDNIMQFFSIENTRGQKKHNKIDFTFPTMFEV